MTDSIVITDLDEDWNKFLKSCCSKQLEKIVNEYPRWKVIRIEFNDFLKFGEVGRRLAESFLDSPNFAYVSGLDAIKNHKLVKIVQTITPGDLKISVVNIPHGDLSECCSPSLQQSRSDSKTTAWKGAVKLRDGFVCRKCGHEDDLQVHHIIPVNKDPSLAWDINNGVTLCKRCHSKFHSGYGVYDLGHYEIHRFLKRTCYEEEGDE